MYESDDLMLLERGYFLQIIWFIEVKNIYPYRLPPLSIINEPSQSDSKILFTCSIIITSRSLRLHAQELYPIKIKEFFFSEKGYYKSFKSKFRSIYVEIELKKNLNVNCNILYFIYKSARLKKKFKKAHRESLTVVRLFSFS